MSVYRRFIRLGARLARRKDSGEQGFTLIELAIVIAVIAVLMAVAFPTFLQVQNDAHHSAAEQDLYNSLAGAKTYYSGNDGSFNNLDAASLESINPSINYTDGAVGPTSSPNSVTFAVDSDDSLSEAVIFATWASGSSNDCVIVIDIAGDTVTSFLGQPTNEGNGTFTTGVWWASQPIPAGGCTTPTVPGTLIWSQTAP
jgi:type IV pilus assembly protein PilA